MFELPEGPALNAPEGASSRTILGAGAGGGANGEATGSSARAESDGHGDEERGQHGAGVEDTKSPVGLIEPILAAAPSQGQARLGR